MKADKTPKVEDMTTLMDMKKSAPLRSCQPGSKGSHGSPLRPPVHQRARQARAGAHAPQVRRLEMTDGEDEVDEAGAQGRQGRCGRGPRGPGLWQLM